jgi:hypothetical protein
MRNASDRSRRENQNMFHDIPPPPENLAFYEIMWKNLIVPGRPQMTIWRMCIACWIPKATNIQPEYVIITDFLLQQELQESTSLHTYTARFAMFCVGAFEVFFLLRYGVASLGDS